MEILTREVLLKLIEEFGHDLLNDKRRLKGLLLDYCGGCRVEVNLLIKAVEADVPKLLLQSNQDVPSELLKIQLTNRLINEYFITQDAAYRAVNTWSYALGLVPSDLPTTLLIEKNEEPSTEIAHTSESQDKRLTYGKLTWGLGGVAIIVLLILGGILEVESPDKAIFLKDEKSTVLTKETPSDFKPNVPTAPSTTDDTARPTATVQPADTPVATTTLAASATPEPTLTPLPTNTMTATPQLAPESTLVVEAAKYLENETALNKTYRVNDPNSTRQCTLGLTSALSQTDDNQGITFTYNIQQASPNDYCGFERWWDKAQNWSGYARLCHDIDVIGTAEDLVVQFGEVSGEVWKSWTATRTMTDGEFCLPLSTAYFTRADWATKQNNVMDLTAITYYGLYVNGPIGASGKVYVNQIWLVKP